AASGARLSGAGRPGEEGISPGKEDLSGEAAGSACSGESRTCGRQTGDDHEYEEEQEVPEGTARRTGIYRDYGGVQWLNQCRDLRGLTGAGSSPQLMWVRL